MSQEIIKEKEHSRAVTSMLNLIKEYIESLKAQSLIGLNDQDIEEEINRWESILDQIEKGALKGVELQMAIDSFFSSIFAIFISITVNTISGLTWADPNMPSALRILAAIVNAYEAVTLVPFLPASGVSGLFRTTYMSIRRVIPYMMSGYKEGSPAKIKQGIIMLIGLNMDGGYVFVPPITAGTIASTTLPGFDMSPMMWKFKTMWRQIKEKIKKEPKLDIES